MAKIFKTREMKDGMQMEVFSPAQIDTGIGMSYESFKEDFDTKNIQQNAPFQIHPSTRKVLSEDQTEEKLRKKKITEEVQKGLLAAEELAYENAYQKGIEAGMQKGFEAKVAEIEAFMTNFEKVLSNFHDAKRIIVERNQNLILEILNALIKKIIHREIALDEKVVARTILSLLKNVGTADEIKITINSKDYKLAEEIKKEIFATYRLKGDVTIEPSEFVECGGCIIETDFGTVDAQISTQLAKMDEIIHEMVKQTQ